MALQAYFDGSGKSHDSEVMTLAAIAAPDDLWLHFDRCWRAALERRQLLWWHSSVAMNGSPSKAAAFVDPSWRNHWNKARAAAALVDLLNLIVRFHWDEWRNGFQILTCTVDIAGYASARAANRLLRPAEAICVNTCVGGLGLHGADARIRLCFDRSEDFLMQVDQVWRKDRKKVNVPWAGQIDEIGPGNARITPGLQAADLLAWHVNRVWRDADQSGILPINGIVCRRYDREAIEREYPPARERWRIEGIEKARRKISETRRVPHGLTDT